MPSFKNVFLRLEGLAQCYENGWTISLNNTRHNAANILSWAHISHAEAWSRVWRDLERRGRVLTVVMPKRHGLIWFCQRGDGDVWFWCGDAHTLPLFPDLESRASCVLRCFSLWNKSFCLAGLKKGSALLCFAEESLWYNLAETCILRGVFLLALIKAVWI